MKTKRKIRDVFDAWWFLQDHPKFNIQVRSEVTAVDAADLEKEGMLITRDPDGTCYRVWRHLWKYALQENLDIFYTKTNKPGGHGRVDDDKSKNKHIECWLEYGPIYYGFIYSGNDKPLGDWDTSTMLHHGHDFKLDCGGVTFDAALVKLAKLVLKHYGDYGKRSRKKECGKPVCGDCGHHTEWAKNQGITSSKP